MAAAGSGAASAFRNSNDSAKWQKGEDV